MVVPVGLERQLLPVHRWVRVSRRHMGGSVGRGQLVALIQVTWLTILASDGLHTCDIQACAARDSLAWPKVCRHCRWALPPHGDRHHWSTAASQIDPSCAASEICHSLLNTYSSLDQNIFMEDGKAIRIPTQFESNVSSRYRNRCIHGEGKCPGQRHMNFIYLTSTSLFLGSRTSFKMYN